MAKASKTWKLVITTIILSLIFLTAFTAIFINFIVPAYDITRQEIYSILSKVFPILVGLVLIEISVLVGRREGDTYKDTIDKLAPNAYDSTLYSPAVDDPMARGTMNANALFDRVSGESRSVSREIIREVPVEVVKEVEIPVEVVKEVPVEIEKEVKVEVPVEVVKEVPVEVQVEVVKEVPVEVIKEIEKPVAVEIIKEVPVEIVREVEVPIEIIKEVQIPVEVEVPVEVIKEVEVPVDVIKEVRVSGETIVKEVPVEIIKEVKVEVPVDVIREVEVPVEIIKEVKVEVPVDVIREVEVPVEIIKEVPVEVIKEVFVEVNKEEESELLTFENALQKEIDEALEGGYNLSIAAFKDRDEASILKVLGEDTLLYNDGKYFYAALPFYSKPEAEKAARLLNPKKVAALNGRKLTAKALLAEASKGL